MRVLNFRQVGNQTGTPLTTASVPKLGHFKAKGGDRRCFSERPPGKPSLWDDDGGAARQNAAAIPSLTGAPNGGRPDNKISSKKIGVQNNGPSTQNGRVPGSSSGMVENGSSKDTTYNYKYSGGVLGGSSKRGMSQESENEDEQSSNPASRGKSLGHQSVHTSSSSDTQDKDQQKLIQQNAKHRQPQTQKTNAEPTMASSTNNNGSHYPPANSGSNQANLRTAINNVKNISNGTHTTGNSSNSSATASAAVAAGGSIVKGGKAPDTGRKTSRKASQVSKCLRCQRLFTATDNHKLACCFHSKDKHRQELYTDGGQLLKVHYVWQCCQQDGDTDGCCYGHHV